MQSWESSVWVRRKWKVSNWKGWFGGRLLLHRVEGSTELAGIVDPVVWIWWRSMIIREPNGETMMMVWVADQEENNWSILSLISMISRQHIFCTDRIGPGLHYIMVVGPCWQRIEKTLSDSASSSSSFLFLRWYQRNRILFMWWTVCLWWDERDWWGEGGE